ncbi:MAG: aminodeoxychorismate synthase component I, partial [Cyclobacteriaceae bacterium]
MISFVSKNEAISRMNRYGTDKTPFLFLISFDQSRSVVLPTDKIDASEIKYRIGDYTNAPSDSGNRQAPFYTFDRHPVSYKHFKTAFDQVIDHISYGNSFLTNLTFETPLTIDLSLSDIFDFSRARYKVWLKDSFCCFSPEIFIRVEGDEISSYPMKGTIEADLPDAEKIILGDKKEQAEHVTIVDLIRNDLSIVADKVAVPKFRYIEKLRTNKNDLLQVSSKISGKLHTRYVDNIGDLIFKLLPAGSISGAPKPQTIAIINDAENHDRGFYTGICGIYDGKNLDSGVMIRFVEKRGDQY